MANNYVEFSFFVKVENTDPATLESFVDEFASKYVEEDEDGDAAFYCEFEVYEGGVWVYAEEYGCVEHAAQLAQAVIKEFDAEPIGFEWAEYCSKARVDEFGGGAVFVTKDAIAYKSTAAMLSEMREQMLNQ